MNRFLKRIFLALAVAFVVFALLVLKNVRAEQASLLHTKIFLGSLVGAVFFLLAALVFKREWKFRVFMVVVTFVLLELLLQATTWLGLIRGINTKNGCPYARVYWSSEGLGNSIRNRFGWYYPEFDLKAPKRIAVIGDSFVEAVEVHRTKNHAALLQQLLRRDSPDWAVLAFGTHGTSPSYHIDVLEYAQKYFKPQEAIIYVYLGNDITESSPALLQIPPADFIYYDLDTNNRLVLNPGSVAGREHLIRHADVNHESLINTLALIIPSHCMTLQAALSARDTLLRHRRQAQLGAAGQAAAGGETVGRELGEMGLNPAPFAITQSDEVKHAMLVMEREIERCQEICDTNGIRLRVVTIPAFPKVFYDTQKGGDWTTRIGNYDFLGPERELVEFAQKKKIQLFPLGDYMHLKRMNVDEIRGLYFINGTGHYTEAGHRFCAAAVYEAFYKPKGP